MLAVVATAPEQLLFAIWVVYQFCVDADGAEVLASQFYSQPGDISKIQLLEDVSSSFWKQKDLRFLFFSKCEGYYHLGGYQYRRDSIFLQL